MRFIDVLERINVLIGRSVSWLTLVMVLVTFLIVVMRYVFGIGWIWLQESVTWMHAAVFMLAAAYTLTREEHVRVDIFYSGLSNKFKAAIDLFGSVIWLIPFSILVIWASKNFVLSAFSIGETSPDPGGLPARYILKACIPLAFFLLVLQGISTAFSSIITLFDEKKQLESKF